jgi:peptidyl-prolyl cis-trans isomerase D
MALALMRRHRRWLYVFLWLVIAAFIILYIPALQDEGQGTPGETVVSVGGQPISVGEFQRSYYRQRQIYDRLYQGRLDEAMLRQLRLDEQVLEGLVSDRLIELEAKRLGVSVSDEALARAIATSPEFQEGGAFIGTGEIRRRLELQGLSEEEFERSLRRQLLRESLESLVGASVSVSDAEVERELRRRTEQVRLEYVVAEAAAFRDGPLPTDEEIAGRFEANKAVYAVPEKRVVSYVLLDRATLEPMVAVTDRDIELYYLDRREEFRQEEEACASHILVRVQAEGAGEGRPEPEARRFAEALLEQVRAGADFAALATRSSEDPGSAASGGDLGCFGPGRMVPEFDDAAFALEPGEVSDLVKTSFGYHIIRLASRRESRVQPLAEVAQRVRASVTDREVRDLGEQKAQALADALGRGRSLEQAAAEEGLVVQRTEAFARGEAPPVLASPTLVAKVFEMKAGQAAKEGFALPQGAAFVSVAEVLPAREPDLAEARERVVSDIVGERAHERARAAVAGVAARAASAGLERAATVAGLVRKETPSFTGRGQPLGDLATGAALEETAFSIAEGALSDPVRTASGWAVLRVLERQRFDPAELERQGPQVAASLRQQKRSELFRAFVLAARERYEVTRDARAYRRALGEEL